MQFQASWFNTKHVPCMLRMSGLAHLVVCADPVRSMQHHGAGHSHKHSALVMCDQVVCRQAFGEELCVERSDTRLCG
jgi:hypothetical protein